MTQTWTSRRLLAVGVAAVAVFSACSPQVSPNPNASSSPSTSSASSPSTTEPAGPSGSSGVVGSYIEPPFLADRVASGALPPIAQRLPDVPVVVGSGFFLQPEFMTWEDGQYGGTINNAATYHTGYIGLAGATLLRSPGQTTSASTPNVLSAFQPSADLKSFQLTIRKGLKWSDGEPVTTEDVRFTLEDLYGNPDAKKPWPNQLYPQGDATQPPATLKVIDDQTFELSFSEPYGWFETELNSWLGNYDFLIKPSHYLKQFHVKYADPTKLAALLKDSGKTDWADLLNAKDLVHFSYGECDGLGMPVLSAWVLTKCTQTSDEYERNPYYFHVDASGHQLPYIDRVVNNIAVDSNAQTNAILAGQLTVASVGETSPDKLPVYQQNAERSNLKVITTGSFQGSFGLWMGQDYEYDKPGSVWQQLINDPQRRFGHAIAAALDPEDVNKTVYFDLGKVPTTTPHDATLANQLLDQLGMDKRGGDGFRLGPDGKPFVFRITWSPGFADADPIAELMKAEIEAVGVAVQLEPISGDLINQKGPGNQLMAQLHLGNPDNWRSGILNDYTDGVAGCCHWYAPATWQYFLTGGKQGRKPPDYLQKLLDLHVARKAYAAGASEGQSTIEQIIKILNDNYIFIPTASRIGVTVADKRLHNLPNEGAPDDIDSYINAEALWFGQ